MTTIGVARRHELGILHRLRGGHQPGGAVRRQGIATALKLRAVVSARDHGVATLTTATGNPVMVRVNQRLGFRLVLAEVRLVRTLQAPRDTAD